MRKRKGDDPKEDRFKKDGKIHSFKRTDNDDDENNTWNGNSTQQMWRLILLSAKKIMYVKILLQKFGLRS